MKIGFNSYISPTAKIVSYSLKNPNIEIGDNCYIGDNVQIICDDFRLGDYSKIHHGTNIHGISVSIGHNAWIGQYTIIDGLGKTLIGDNCGVGAHSQLWSHIKYGDTFIGCQYESYNSLIVENDVWFVGHCIVSPVLAKAFSMALVGSVITKNMESNHIYGGSPAKDLTDKIGCPFQFPSVKEKEDKFLLLLKEFGATNNIVMIHSLEEIKNDDKIYFNIIDRKYTKKLLPEEIAFMKFLLPAKAKFTPYDSL